MPDPDPDDPFVPDPAVVQTVGELCKKFHVADVAGALAHYCFAMEQACVRAGQRPELVAQWQKWNQVLLDLAEEMAP